MVFAWFSEKFQELLNKNKVFEKLVDDSFGPSQIRYYNAYSSKPVDVRDTLRFKGASEPLMRSVLKEIGIKDSDDMDVKVEKIRDFVNARLDYVSDDANYIVPQYFAHP